MPRRLDKTLVDYLVIAISPALVMALVGSLVFFLIEVFYRGNFHGRLQYIFALFVIGAVLIGRISIEEGRERAALFALPLGVTILMAINRFVEFQGGLAPLSFPINLGLIALVWWSADKLTWDCTLIDESKEDSGEGLLEAVGLDRPQSAALEKEIDPAPPEPEATTARDQPPGWWERFVERRRRPHAPGVWVVYFSLAALPLFGVGQLLIPADNLSARQDAFLYLFVYTASGLGLLLSTSFLGLRRYLRQRRQEMPAAMAGLWLGIGAVLIVGVMLGAMLLPRPNAEYALSDLPFRVGSPDQTSSPYGMGSDGVNDDRSPASGPTSTVHAEKAPSGGQKEPAKGKDGASDQEKPAAGDQEKPATGDQARPVPDNQGPAKQQGDRSQPGSSTKPGGETKTGDQRSDGRGKDRSEQPKSDKAPQKEPAKGKDGASDKEKNDGSGRPATGEKPSGDARPHGSPTPRALPRVRLPANVPALLAAVLKWIFYGALAIVALFLLWKNRKELAAALGNLIEQLAGFWHRLFGGRRRRDSRAAEEAAAPAAPVRRFADFADPFAVGIAGRYPPRELVRYTFEALEAWARDRGCPRRPDQTPHEFVRSLASHCSSFSDDASQLANLYCQVAYSPGVLPAADTASLSRLWRSMSEAAGAALAVS